MQIYPRRCCKDTPANVPIDKPDARFGEPKNYPVFFSDEE